MSPLTICKMPPIIWILTNTTNLQISSSTFRFRIKDTSFENVESADLPQVSGWGCVERRQCHIFLHFFVRRASLIERNEASSTSFISQLCKILDPICLRCYFWISDHSADPLIKNRLVLLLVLKEMTKIR